MNIHTTITPSVQFWPVVRGEKKFLLLKDIDFKVGDSMVLREVSSIDEHTYYTGEEYKINISYKLRNFAGLEKGYCIIGLE